MVPHVWSSSDKGQGSKGDIEKPKLEKARKQNDICFIVLEAGELKETISNVGKKVQVLTEAAVPCKLRTLKRCDKSRVTDEVPTRSKRQRMHACIVEAHESTRKRLEPHSTKKS